MKVASFPRSVAGLMLSVVLFVLCPVEAQQPAKVPLIGFLTNAKLRNS
jgi:hypothetical protein